MREIYAIATNTFKEAIRNRILYFILIFALALILLSGVLSELTIAGRTKIMLDFGFTAINFFGVAIAVFVGVSLVYNELEKKSIYTIVSKPIGRWQFLLGKYFGLLLTVVVNIAVMSLFFLWLVHYYGVMDEKVDAGFLTVLTTSAGRAVASFFWWPAYGYAANIMPVVALMLVELSIVTGFAVLFSSFSTPTLSMMFTVMVFIAGRLNEDIVRFSVQLHDKALVAAQTMGTTLEEQLSLSYYLARVAAYVTPNLGVFTRSVNQAVYENQIQIWPWSILYGLLYTTAILALAIMIFQRRNFK